MEIHDIRSIADTCAKRLPSAMRILLIQIKIDRDSSSPTGPRRRTPLHKSLRSENPAGDMQTEKGRQQGNQQQGLERQTMSSCMDLAG